MLCCYYELEFWFKKCTTFSASVQIVDQRIFTVTAFQIFKTMLRYGVCRFQIAILY